MLLPQLSLSLMASKFASKMIYFSEREPITNHLSELQKSFIVDLISALQTFTREDKWDHAIVSGAAFLFWMFGISKPEDVEHTVLGILRTGKGNTTADGAVVNRVKRAINAMRSKFGVHGKSLDVQKDTEITTSLLAKWSASDEKPPIYIADLYLAAQVSLIYEPEKVISSARPGMKNYVRQCYVHILESLREKTIDSSTEINDAMLQRVLARIELFEGIEDDVTVETTNQTEDNTKLKTTKESKSKPRGRVNKSLEISRNKRW